MTGSLKRHPSEEPEESPKSKRRESPGDEVSSSAPTPTETSPTAADKNGENSAPTSSPFLSPPTKVGGVSITDKVSLTEDASKVNGTNNSILSSGFSISSGPSLFSASNGQKEGSSNSSSSTNIFAAALANVSGGGIFGSTSSFSSGSSFVFGANLTNRVTSFGTISSEAADKKDTSDESNVTETKEETPPAESSTEASAESSKDKVSLKELEVTSGEEGERRILQTSCKLYQFCPASKTWIERGQGTLRLNEKEQDGRTYNRLVIRSKAVMKVMLNTKIFPDMVINRANLTTIRISALDGGKMCTFLLKCTRNECDKLHTVLLKRRETERHNTEAEGSGTTETAKPHPEQPASECRVSSAATSTTTLDKPNQNETTATSGETTGEKPEEEKREVEEDEEEVEGAPEPSTAEEKESKEEGSKTMPEADSTETVNGAKSKGVTDETPTLQKDSEEDNSEPSKETS